MGGWDEGGMGMYNSNRAGVGGEGGERLRASLAVDTRTDAAGRQVACLSDLRDEQAKQAKVKEGG